MSFSPTIGRWMQRDPEGYLDGMNPYQYEGSDPASSLDPSGLIKIKIDADAFIPAQWVSHPTEKGQLKGDGRGISSSPGASSRIASWVEVELEEKISKKPLLKSGSSISPTTWRYWYETQRWGFAGEPPRDGRWIEKTATGTHSATLNAERTGPCTVMVYIQHTGRLPTQFVALAPSIDYGYKIELKQTGSQAEFHAAGSHDGFPGYELYIAGNLVHAHDPQKTGKGPVSLFPPKDHGVDVRGGTGGWLLG